MSSLPALTRPSQMQSTYWPMTGGEDMVSPALALKPGSLILSKNYECRIEGGYRRIPGYERFDGRASPHKATYHTLPFQAGGPTPITAGDTIEGATSGATGVVLATDLSDGAWGTGDAEGAIAITKLTGTFDPAGEDIEIASVKRAESTGPALAQGFSGALHRSTLMAARELYRADIQPITGSGPIRGVWMYKNAVFAFRDDAGGANGVMWGSTASGWQQVDLGGMVRFDNGTTAFVVGDTLTGGTSGATGTITAVIVDSGDWVTNDAEGRIYLKGISGTYQNNETVTGTVGSAQADGASVLHTLPPGGKYRFLNYNFGGHLSQLKMYGVNGVGNAFEFDGSGFVPIVVENMFVDTPTHLEAFYGRLVLAYPGGSLQYSPIGQPTGEWTAILGSAEIAVGDEITGLQTLTGESLAIWTRNGTKILYGAPGTTAMELRTHARESGAIADTIQVIGGMPVFLDDRGLTLLAATQAFGDFATATISQVVQPFLSGLKNKAVAATRNRTRSLYRLHFEDRNTLIAAFNGMKLEGFTRAAFDHELRCACSSEDDLGDERSFFGSDEGWVFEMDVGTSFDGQAYESFLRTAFHHYKSPHREKQFRMMELELDAEAETEIQFLLDFDYSSALVPPSIPINFPLVGGGAYWNFVNWNQFIWSGDVVSSAIANVSGFGRNMSMVVYSQSDYDPPHTLQGVVVRYSMRRLIR